MLSGLIFPGGKIRYKGLLIVYNRDQCKGAGKSIDACAKLSRLRREEIGNAILVKQRPVCTTTE